MSTALTGLRRLLVISNALTGPQPGFGDGARLAPVTASLRYHQQSQPPPVHLPSEVFRYTATPTTYLVRSDRADPCRHWLVVSCSAVRVIRDSRPPPRSVVGRKKHVAAKPFRVYVDIDTPSQQNRLLSEQNFLVSSSSTESRVITADEINCYRCTEAVVFATNFCFRLSCSFSRYVGQTPHRILRSKEFYEGEWIKYLDR